MENSSEWTRRKIQEVSGGSYRMSIPKSFAQDLNHVEYRQTGDYLVARPDDYSDSKHSLLAPFPDKLYDTDPVEDADSFYSIAANLVQSLCIASADEIAVVFPDDLDKSRADVYEDAWYRVHRHARDELRWDVDEKVMEVREGLDMEEFIDDVRQYLYRYLIIPLENPEALLSNKFDFREVDEGPGLHSDILEDEEASIDTRWSLAIRNLSEGLYDLQRASYPQILCGFYIGKYLEMCIDLVKRLTISIGLLEKEFHSEYPELVSSVKTQLATVFLDDDHSFDKKIRDIAENSYNLDVSSPEFMDESENFYEKMEMINEFRRDRFFDDVDTVEDADPTDLAELGLLVGEIMTLTERILRFPRSICHLGVGAGNVAEARRIR